MQPGHDKRMPSYHDGGPLERHEPCTYLVLERIAATITCHSAFLDFAALHSYGGGLK